MLPELYFYKKYYEETDFLPYVYKIIVSPNRHNIKIYMSYEGIDLFKLSNIIAYNKRIQMVPTIIDQLLDILRWLKNKNIIHMDIKPSNICFNQNLNQIKLIDFGNTIPYDCCVLRHHIGTYEFADPSYVDPKIHKFSYDMYSAGITILYWISKIKLTNFPKNNKYLCDKYFKPLMLSNDISNFYISLLQSMTELDENTRINIDDINININTCIYLDYINEPLYTPFPEVAYKYLITLPYVSEKNGKELVEKSLLYCINYFDLVIDNNNDKYSLILEQINKID